VSSRDLSAGEAESTVNDEAIDLEDFEPAGMTQEELIETVLSYRTDAEPLR